jgi:putative ATPase
VVESVGLPECQFAIAQAVVYMACAPKSNAVTLAIGAARDDVRANPTLPVPPHLRDQSYRPRGQRSAYRYPHEAPHGIVAQDYLGAPRRYYNPSRQGFEAQLAQRLEWIRRVLGGDDAAGPPESGDQAGVP